MAMKRMTMQEIRETPPVPIETQAMMFNWLAVGKQLESVSLLLLDMFSLVGVPMGKGM